MIDNKLPTSVGSFSLMTYMGLHLGNAVNRCE